jgi:hypothetical protein
MSDLTKPVFFVAHTQAPYNGCTVHDARLSRSMVRLGVGLRVLKRVQRITPSAYLK